MGWIKEEQTEAQARLKDWLKPGDRLWFVMRGVSRTGMTRYMDVVMFHEDNGEIAESWLTWNVACALGRRFNRSERSRGKLNYETLVVGGCGFCPANDVTMHLSRMLFGDDRALKYGWV